MALKTSNKNRKKVWDDKIKKVEVENDIFAKRFAYWYVLFWVGFFTIVFLV